MKMIQAFFISTVTLLICRNATAGESVEQPTNAPALIEMRDQFDALQKLSFPTTNVTILTIADKRGSEQIAGWVAPLKQRFGPRIDIRGMADVSGVPSALRGMVRKRFQKLQAYPVMMDWSGVTVKAFTSLPGKANILVLDGRGQILQRTSGEATVPAIKDLCGVIDRALASQGLQAAKK